MYFQLRIQFDDKALSTHEYQSETSALAQYLEENPHEKDEVEKEKVEIEQTSISLDLESSESSDDVVETPRDSSAMKSNTAIGAGKPQFIRVILFVYIGTLEKKNKGGNHYKKNKQKLLLKK